jgi:hypothetical protein
MKGFGGPKASLRLLALIDQRCQLRGLLIIDNSHSTRPLFDNQPVNTALKVYIFLKKNTIAVVMFIIISGCYTLDFRLLANLANGTYL